MRVPPLTAQAQFQHRLRESLLVGVRPALDRYRARDYSFHFLGKFPALRKVPVGLFEEKIRRPRYPLQLAVNAPVGVHPRHFLFPPPGDHLQMPLPPLRPRYPQPLQP